MDRYVDSVREVSWSDEQRQLWKSRLSVPNYVGKPMGLFVHEYADGSELRLGPREAIRIHPDGTQVVDASGAPVELDFPECLRNPRLLSRELQDDHQRAERGCSDAGAFVLLLSAKNYEHAVEVRLFRLNLEPLQLTFDPTQSKLPLSRDSDVRISNDGKWLMSLGLVDYPNSLPLWRARVDLSSASIGEPEIMIDNIRDWNIHLYRIMNDGDALFYTMGVGQIIRDTTLRYWRLGFDFWETIELPESISNCTDLHFINGDFGPVVYGQLRLKSEKRKGVYRAYTFEDGKLTFTRQFQLVCPEKLVPFFPDEQDFEFLALMNKRNAPGWATARALVRWNSDGKLVSLNDDFKARRWKVRVASRKSSLLLLVASHLAVSAKTLEGLPEELVSLIAKLR
jgi:hypothetical protein